jgi:integrase
LKVLALKCDIEKEITSHWGRRTAGMIMLNNGVPIGVVSRILGHASVRTTERAYAFLLDKTIDNEMIRFAERMKEKGAK